VDGVWTVRSCSALAAANLHEALADEFVVRTTELNVVQSLRAPRSTAAVAATSRAVLESKQLNTSTLAVLQGSRLGRTPATTTLVRCARR